MNASGDNQLPPTGDPSTYDAPTISQEVALAAVQAVFFEDVVSDIRFGVEPNGGLLVALSIHVTSDITGRDLAVLIDQRREQFAQAFAQPHVLFLEPTLAADPSAPPPPTEAIVIRAMD